LTTSPDPFKRIHLDSCESTSDHIRRNLPGLESDFPLVVSAAAQSSGRGRDGREWLSTPGLGLYATFAFHLPASALPFLSIASGVAVAGMLERWTGREFALKWPNDVLADGRKIAGILCESIVRAEKITCLVGIGVNVNHETEDFPAALRGRAGSLRIVTGAAWPVAEGRERLVTAMAAWLKKLESGRSAPILRRARRLSRCYLRREIAFHHQGQVLRGVFRGLAADGGLRLQAAGRETKVFYSGEWLD